MSLPCRHAIAFRQQKGVAGPLIPWVRIDARWTSSGQQLNQVKQFCYDTFGDSTSSAPVKAALTHSERYKEAVRATHLIASELADIEGQQGSTSS
ncbi:hypothetical protein V7S43_016000 [Phytophthora oleae]|uniref:Zinc finger PMZ-type domain-containing protein n=1 Tax=Phytophthora oleae TaxID=2107226 RepID=A0ABD3EY43_9STRA